MFFCHEETPGMVSTSNSAERLQLPLGEGAHVRLRRHDVGDHLLGPTRRSPRFLSR
jgi:hypothetical protein